MVGPWVVDLADSPAPESAQATLADLCDTALDPEERMALAVTDPVADTIYAMDCCGPMELFFFDPVDPEGFDYEFDFGLN